MYFNVDRMWTSTRERGDVRLMWTGEGCQKPDLFVGVINGFSYCISAVVGSASEY